MDADAGDLREVTGGDSVDCSPSWVEASSDRIVYQSAGIGRDAAGNYAELGCYGIHELDLHSGVVREIASSPDHDLLGPRMSADGTVHYIRRPKRETRMRSLAAVLKDVVLFPFRLLGAFLHYLNFFSARYSGKPLTTAGGPRRDGPDLREMVIWGNVLNARGSARGAGGKGDDPPPLAPRSWHLIRQRPGAEPTRLAEHVLSFDVGADGSVVYSTGSAIYRLGPSAARTRMATGAGIEQVIVLR